MRDILYVRRKIFSQITGYKFEKIEIFDEGDWKRDSISEILEHEISH